MDGSGKGEGLRRADEAGGRAGAVQGDGPAAGDVETVGECSSSGKLPENSYEMKTISVCRFESLRIPCSFPHRRAGIRNGWPGEDFFVRRSGDAGT